MLGLVLFILFSVIEYNVILLAVFLNIHGLLLVSDLPFEAI
jgi:hypothetical protein